ncbi:MAG: DUF819 family protein [Myxococcota bacterium]
MLGSVFQVLMLLLLPAGAIALEKRSRVARVVPTILVCYLAGIAIGNVPWVPIDTKLSLAVCSATVALAIPLLLFSVDIVAWLKMARATVISFGLCIVAVFVVSMAASFVFRDAVPESHKVAAMLVGVYTGGTPNMAAIGTALGVSPEMFVKLNSADIVTAAIYLPFLFALAPKVWGWILRPFPPEQRAQPSAERKDEKKLPSIKQLSLGVVLAGLVVGAGIGVGRLLPESFRDAVTILVLTTSAVLLSLHPRIRRLEGTHGAGQYILLVFCVAVGTTAKFDELLTSSLTILGYTAVIMFGSALVHVGLAALFRIDRDTVIITSTAAIFGPAFIGPVAVSLNNRQLVVSGIATSLVGLAVGNYAGLLVAWILA